MTMKFKMPSKEEAYRIKNVIREEAEMFDFVTVEDVKRYCAPISQLAEIEDDDKTSGWRYADLVGNHFFVRKTKDGWFLFICDPRLNVRVLKTDEDSVDEETHLDDETKEFLDCLTHIVAFSKDTRRKVMIRRKKKEYPGWFLYARAVFIRPATVTTPEVVDDWFMCEFQDGHCERVKFDHVRFVNEWE